MTRESKLALIIGFVLILVVGVLVSDHLSQASNATIDPNTGIERTQPFAVLPDGQHQRAVIDNAIENPPSAGNTARNPLLDEPIVIAQGAREPSVIHSIFDKVGSLTDTGVPGLVADGEIKGNTEDQPKAQRSYTVRANDSLYAIARSLLGDGERWREIHTLNARLLGPDAVLQPGMVLVLPSDARGSTGSTTLSDQRRPIAPRPVAPTTYEVQPGDALSMISQRLLGTSKRAREIADLNGLKDLDDIRIGMVLKIPAR